MQSPPFRHRRDGATRDLSTSTASSTHSHAAIRALMAPFCVKTQPGVEF